MVKCNIHGEINHRMRQDAKGYFYRVCPACDKIRHARYNKKHRLRILVRKAKTRTKWAFNINEKYVKYIFKKQKGLCALTKLPLLNSSSIDRINSNKGYIKGNVQLLLTIINRMKRDLCQKDFIQYCKEIARNN